MARAIYKRRDTHHLYMQSVINKSKRRFNFDRRGEADLIDSSSATHFDSRKLTLLHQTQSSQKSKVVKEGHNLDGGKDLHDGERE